MSCKEVKVERQNCVLEQPKSYTFKVGDVFFIQLQKQHLKLIVSNPIISSNLETDQFSNKCTLFRFKQFKNIADSCFWIDYVTESFFSNDRDHF